MPEDNAWVRWGRYAAAAVLAGAVAWFAFIAHTEVPILDWFDLAVHEAGHMVLMFAPRIVMFLAGSASQVMVPLALAWYFGFLRRDAAGGGFCLTWAGAAAWDVSVYIADAPVRALPLIGSGEHDWAFLLGSRGFGAIDLADEIAGFVEFTGAVLAITGIAIALAAMISGLKKPPPELEAAPVVDDAVVGPDPWLDAASLPFRHEGASQPRP